MCLALKANGAFLAFCFNSWVILEVSDDGTLEALQFIHTSLGVRTVAIVSPLSGDCGGENKNLRLKTILNN